MRPYLSISAMVISGLFCCSSFSSESFSIEPMEISLKPGAMAAQIYLHNRSSKKIQVSLTAFERREDGRGRETRVATKDLELARGAVEISAGAVESVKVSYSGALRIPKEKAYRVIVKEEALTGLRLIYEASVFVSPSEAKPEIVVEKLRWLNDRQLEVAVFNKGLSHQKMNSVRPLILKVSDGTSIDLKLKDGGWERFSRDNMLAGTRRKFLLELDAAEPLFKTEKFEVRWVP